MKQALRIIGSLAFVALCLLFVAVAANGAEQPQSKNFSVTGPAFSEEFIRQASYEMERVRDEIAERFLGYRLPQWSAPCKVRLNRMAENSSGGGSTSFVVDQGEVTQFSGTWGGSEDKLMADVIPHEVTHAVMVSHFRAIVPRWLDEGLASVVESQAARRSNDEMLVNFLRSGQGIPTAQTVRMTSYPQAFMVFYCQAASQCRFLIAIQGEQHFVEFMGEAIRTDSAAALSARYGFSNPNDFQSAWMAWLRQGSQMHTAFYSDSAWPPCPNGLCPLQQRPAYRQEVIEFPPMVNTRPAPRPQSPAATPYQPPVVSVPKPQQPAACKCAAEIADLKKRVSELEHLADIVRSLPPATNGKDGKPGPQGPAGDTPVIKPIKVIYEGGGAVPDRIVSVSVDGGELRIPPSRLNIRDDINGDGIMSDGETFRLAVPLGKPLDIQVLGGIKAGGK